MDRRTTAGIQNIAIRIIAKYKPALQELCVLIFNYGLQVREIEIYAHADTAVGISASNLESRDWRSIGKCTLKLYTDHIYIL